MKLKSCLRCLLLAMGISIGIFVASRFAVVSTRMVMIAASQYLQDIMFLK